TRVPGRRPRSPRPGGTGGVASAANAVGRASGGGGGAGAPARAHRLSGRRLSPTSPGRGGRTDPRSGLFRRQTCHHEAREAPAHVLSPRSPPGLAGRRRPRPHRTGAGGVGPVKFTKMQGLGNDFVVLEDVEPAPDLVRQLCDRRRGVGADGVLTVDARPSMRYWNADGSVAEMCGNGLRCVARYAVDRNWAPNDEWFVIETAVGPRRALVADPWITVEVG